MINDFNNSLHVIVEYDCLCLKISGIFPCVSSLTFPINGVPLYSTSKLITNGIGSGLPPLMISCLLGCVYRIGVVELFVMFPYFLKVILACSGELAFACMET